MFSVRRHPSNPILRPDETSSWEAEAAFNGCPIKTGSIVHLVYRGTSSPHYHAESGYHMEISDIGHAVSADGIHFKNRHRLVTPSEPWDRYGCEDPRVTKMEGRYYIFYTALSTYPFSIGGIKVGLAVTRDFKHIEEKHPVTPFNAKAMALFPEKIHGKYVSVLTVHTDAPPAKITLAYADSLDHLWLPDFWHAWHTSLDARVLPIPRIQSDHIEVGAPPIKTKYGWLLVFFRIRNYGQPDYVAGIELAVLDLKDPQNLLMITPYPLLTPETEYERYGRVPKIIFPSGAIVLGDILRIYYGAADMTCCVAETQLSKLVETLLAPRKHYQFTRPLLEPILSPNPQHPWEAKAVFNPGAILVGNTVHILYRAMSLDHTSVFGYAALPDGIHADDRSLEPVYIPRESFEQKIQPGGNSGCEDPRLTLIGNTVYMLYTAYDGQHAPRIALTSIPLRKFLNKVWEWKSPVLISPPDFDNKDACLFPEKIKGQYLILHRMGDDIDLAQVPHLDFDGATWLEERIWLKPRKGYWDSRKVGVAAPPLKTLKGWILFYHGISDHGTYRVGAVLLDLRDPSKILARTYAPLFSPEAEFEKSGQISFVVFPCGAVLIKDTVYLYYGGADTYVGVATIEVKNLLKLLS